MGFDFEYLCSVNIAIAVIIALCTYCITNSQLKARPEKNYGNHELRRSWAGWENKQIKSALKMSRSKMNLIIK